MTSSAVPLPSPIRGNEPGSFPWRVLHQRHPELIRRVREAHPYPPVTRQALQRLLEEITTGAISPLPDDAYDREQWRHWERGYLGLSWFDVPFLWAESYFYRRLLEAVGYFADGPWRGIDPFGPAKAAELADASALATELAALGEVVSLPEPQRWPTLLRAALWGNRADLGFRISDPGVDSRDRVTDLIVDDSAQMTEWLTSTAPGPVCLVADNAGRELLPDLILIDHLLHTGLAERVELHVKPYPYFVSDATTADVIECLRQLLSGPEPVVEAGRRLWRALSDGGLEIYTHSFYRAPLSYHDLPANLADRFARARLTIMKGDLNYRRLVGDRHWPATSTFEELTAYFPGPVATLRTLKSDVIVGLDEATLAALEASGANWRTSGTHALIQARLAPASDDTTRSEGYAQTV